MKYDRERLNNAFQAFANKVAREEWGIDAPKVIVHLKGERTGYDMIHKVITIGLEQLSKEKISCKLAVCHELYHYYQHIKGDLGYNERGTIWNDSIYTAADLKGMRHYEMPWELEAIAFERAMAYKHGFRLYDRFLPINVQIKINRKVA